MLTGSPRIELRATGPLGNDPALRADLERERAEAEEEIARAKLIPHISFGLRYRIGGR